MSKNISILVLTHNFPRFKSDYIATYLSLLVKMLVAHDIRPVVIAPHDRGLPEYEEQDGVKIYRFRYAASEDEQTIAYRGNMHQLVLGSVSGIFKFKEFLDRFRATAIEVIQKEKIDVVTGHWLVPAGLVMRPLMRRTGLPMILSSHGTDIRLMNKYMRALYRYLRSFCHRLDRWTVVSNYLKSEILKVDPSLAHVMEVMPMPHDETLFYRDERVRHEDNLIVSVTRFTDQKRPEILIKAFALVVKQIPAGRLQIYGAGPLESDMRILISDLGLNDSVTINAPVDQTKLRSVYNRASIVVLNSVQEGFGLALSEAMMCGSAVIGANSGGITDIIEHEKRGLLVEPDNKELLAEAIIRLMEDNQLRQTLADTGHDFAHEAYSSGPQAKRYADMIREIYQLHYNSTAE